MVLNSIIVHLFCLFSCFIWAQDSSPSPRSWGAHWFPLIIKSPLPKHEPPLLAAIEEDDLNALIDILETEALTGYPLPFLGNALIRAAKLGRYDIVTYLFENYSISSPLHGIAKAWAIHNQHYEIADYFDQANVRIIEPSTFYTHRTVEIYSDLEFPENTIYDDSLDWNSLLQSGYYKIQGPS